MTGIRDVLDVVAAPRLPRRSPVVILHLRADNDTSGNPRRCFAVLTPRGSLVEVIDEGYGGEGDVRARWPWFSHSVAADIGLDVAYAVPVDVSPGEYRRWMKRDRDEWYAAPARLRARADRCEAFSRTVEAWQSIWRASVARDPDDRNALVYHRTPSAGGGAVEAEVRRNMRALERAGLIERVSLTATHGSYALTHAAQPARVDSRGVVEVLDVDAYDGGDVVTCGACGRSWDDSVPTSVTPAPSARCPFEDRHADEDGDA